MSFGCALFMAITLAGAAWGQSDPIKAYRQGDYATAHEIWLSLAKKGNSAAQYNIGLLYQHGLGVTRHFAEAVKWYTQAAQGGDADAQAKLGDFILEGHWGSGRETSAVKWYRLAAGQGHRKAQRQLGILLSQGKGVERDPDEAIEWLRAASDQGDSVAARWLRGLERQRHEKPAQLANVMRPNVGRSLRPPNFGSQGNCPSSPRAPYDIHVRVEIPTPPINHRLSIKQLGKKMIHGPRSRILGLTQSDLRVKTRGHYSVERSGDKFCFSVRAIDVILKYQALQVYVAKEYKVGSCAFRAVLAHERDHVRVARENLESYTPKIRSVLTSLLIPTGSEPIQVVSAKAAKAKMKSITDELLGPVYKEMFKTLKMGQAALDTPQQYLRVRNKCSRW
ncbi:MAG: tetratricopeptide repeat protein [Alphaproteobacteria bacterium]